MGGKPVAETSVPTPDLRAGTCGANTLRTCARCGDTDGRNDVDGRLVFCRKCGSVRALELPIGGALADVAPAAVARFTNGGILRGKYRILERLGCGGHGTTYLAEHVYLGHRCVVKTLPEWHSETANAFITHLRDEARAGYRVLDPHVVRVLECDVIRGTWYFVMEFVDGVDLAAVVRAKRRLPWQQVRQLAFDAVRGLKAIWDAGLVHRDIKPGNLLLGADGRLRIADLGVARLAGERQDVGQTALPEMVGTLDYAAPEVFASGVELGPAADAYSLGASLYHLLTGRPPHQASKVFQRLIDMQNRPVQWPADDDTTPERLRRTVLRLLAIEPEQRPTNEIELATLFRPADVPDDEAPSGHSESVQRIVDALDPRGVGVIPFRCVGDDTDVGAAWLGAGLANGVWRALSELPGLYVADPDTLQKTLDKLGVVAPTDEPRRVMRAGRLVGAGTVIGGAVRQSGDSLHVSLEAYRAGQSEPEHLAEVTGAVSELGPLEHELYQTVLKALAISPQASVRPPRHVTLPVQAREKFEQARQAFLRGAYDTAIEVAEQAVQVGPHYAEAIGFIGVCLARQGRYGRAEAQHRAQENLAQEWGDARLEIEALANLGVMNYFRGQYDEAEPQLTRAATLAEEHRLATEAAQVFNNLGFVRLRREKFSEAEDAFRRAIDTHRKFGGLAPLVGPYNGMGNVLSEQGRHAEARRYYRRALALAREAGDRSSVGNTHIHLARCAVLLGDDAEAQHQFTMGLSTLEETGFWNGLARAYEFMADMNLRRANYAEALRCVEQRIALAQQHTNASMEASAWEQKAVIYRAMTRDDEAADCTERSRQVRAALEETL